MKKFVCIVLALCLCLSCCACGAGSYGVKTVLTLVEQEYSLAFRNDDGIYFYVTAAIEQLNAEGAARRPRRSFAPSRRASSSSQKGQSLYVSEYFSPQTGQRFIAMVDLPFVSVYNISP